MEQSTTDPETTSADLPTYQCVVCQFSFTSLNDLHRHQSYRHTSEELSLSTIGLQCSSIRIFEFPNGIVYDNSWLCDPSKHAEFYTYSAKMLSDDDNNNNNGCAIDYAFRNDGLEEKNDCSDKEDKECMEEDKEEEFVAEHAASIYSTNSHFAIEENFIQEPSQVLDSSTILDLRVQVSSDAVEEPMVEFEGIINTTSDNFVDSVKMNCNNLKNLRRDQRGKRRKSPAKSSIPRKARKLTMPKKKAQSPEHRVENPAEEDDKNAEKPEEEDIDAGNSIGQDSAFCSQETVSWFDSEDAKMRLFARDENASVSQKKVLNHENGNCAGLSSIGSDELFFGFGPDEVISQARPVTSAKKSTPSRKRAKDPRIAAKKPAKPKTPKKKVTIKRCEIPANVNRSLFDGENFSSRFAQELAKIDEPRVLKAKQRISAGKKSISLANKLVKPKTSHEDKVSPNENNGNDDSAKKGSLTEISVYAYTSEDEEKITSLSEFRAKKPGIFRKNSNKTTAGDENAGDSNNSSIAPVASTSTDAESKRVTINVPPAKKTKKLIPAIKKKPKSKKVSFAPVAPEIAQKIAKSSHQEHGNENSVERNSTAISEVYDFTGTAKEETRIEAISLPAKTIKKPRAGPKKSIKRKTAAGQKSAQETTPVVVNPLNGDCENINSGDEILPVIAEELLPVYERVDTGVTFPPYPPDLDDNSVLVFDPVAGELVWTSLDLQDTLQCENLIEDSNEIPRLERFDDHDDNRQECLAVESETTTTNVVNDQPSTSLVEAGTSSLSSNDAASLQNDNLARRHSSRTKKVIDRYVP